MIYLIIDVKLFLLQAICKCSNLVEECKKSIHTNKQKISRLYLSKKIYLVAPVFYNDKSLYLF